MLGVTHRLRSWRLATAVLALCAGLLLASSSAEAMICSIDEAAQELEETPSSSPLVVERDTSTMWIEFRAPTQAPPTRACTALDPEECQWNFPEGTPEPTRSLSLRKPLAALLSVSMTLPTLASIRCAARSHDSGERDAYRARVFRPPRRQ